MLPKLLDIVMRAQGSILRMKEYGLYVDKQKMHNLCLQEIANGSRYDSQLSTVVGKAGFNARSPQQVAALLYNELGLPTQYKRGSKGRTVTTDDEAIQKVCGIVETSPYVFSPVPGHDPDRYTIGTLILKARHAVKLASTYYSLQCDEDSRVHPDWKMHGTETGRLACAKPPIQTYPPGPPRSIFIAPPGKRLGYYDLSQVEFRIMIYESKDPTGMALLESGGDIHKNTASRIFNIPIEEVTGEQRFQAKFVNYGLPYGRGPESLAQQHNVSGDEARRIYDDHRDTFPVLWAWLRSLCEFSRTNKYIPNTYGRRRWFIDTSDDERERQTQNMVPQSTAHDIMLQILNDIDEELVLKGVDFHVIADMHDALLTEEPLDQKDEIAEHVMEIFNRERLPGLKIPTDKKHMTNWGEAAR